MNSRAALISLHFAVLLFGLSGLIGKAVSSPALVVTCLRSLVGALALAAFLALRRESALAAWRGRIGVLLASGALLAVHWWTFFAAIGSYLRKNWSFCVPKVTASNPPETSCHSSCGVDSIRASARVRCAMWWRNPSAMPLPMNCWQAEAVAEN